MPKVTKEERAKEKKKHAKTEELWQGNDVHLFDPPTLLSEAVTDEACLVVRHARDVDIKALKGVLKEELKSVEAAYRLGRIQHDKPKRDWYVKQYSDFQKAIKQLQNELSSVKGIARQALEMRISTSLKNEPVSSIRGFQDAFDSLSIVCSRLLKEFKTNEESSIIRPANPGARDSAHIKYSVAELIKVWETLTREKFVYNFQSAKNKKDLPEFIRPCVQFVFVVLQGFDEGMTVNSVKHAILSHRKASGRKSNFPES